MCSLCVFKWCKGSMSSNTVSEKLESAINGLVSWLKSSKFSKDVPVNNYDGCYRIIAAMTHGTHDAGIDLRDVRSIACAFVNAEKIRCKVDGSESAGYIFKMMFDDEVVTPSRSTLMIAGFQLADMCTKSNVSPKVKDKSTQLRARNIKQHCFVNLR